MRLSCNGCRVLRKGCSDACTISPCLQWIKSPDAQANATVFLAKFYGRAGLLNLLAAAPDDAARPAVFRSLLYEACGRIVNPVYGAVGLLWSGTWHLCQAAVEAVLKGAPIVVQVSADDAAATAAAAAYDIRHVFPNKHQSPPAAGAPPPPPPPAAAAQSSKDDKYKHTDRGLLHKVVKVSKPKFKRTSSSSSPPSNKTKSNTTTTTQNKQPHLAAAAAAAASPATEHDDMVVAQVHHSDVEEEQHAAVGQPSNSSNAKSRRRASSDDDDCDEDRHSASASLNTHDSEEAASHVSQALVADDHQLQAEAEQQQPPSMGLGLDLTLGLLTTTTAAPPHIAPPTHAACSAAVDEPAGVIAFRFL